MRRTIDEWPKTLDPDRELAIIALDSAAFHAQAAQADPVRVHEAGVRAHVACRRCLRLVLAACVDWPGSKRIALRRRAILELIEQHAQAGIVLAAALQDENVVNGERRRALLDLLVVLADLAYYLDVLGRGGWAGEL